MGKGVIPIGDAKRISKERGVPMVVVFAIHADHQRFTVTTYGATKGMCRLAGDYGKRLAEAIMSGRVSPSQTEPIDIPDQPTVWEKEGGA